MLSGRLRSLSLRVCIRGFQQTSRPVPPPPPPPVKEHGMRFPEPQGLPPNVPTQPEIGYNSPPPPPKPFQTTINAEELDKAEQTAKMETKEKNL